MMHVAEAGEAKGRVVVQLCSGRASPVAIEAAIWLARAFQSEIESLFVEDQQLIELARYPFAREISFSGRSSRALSCEEVERQLRFASAAFHSEIEVQARAADVPFRPRVMRDEPVNALAVACAERGPWNAVALAQPFTSSACPPLKQLFETVSGTTGLLVVGPGARSTPGPIVLALEQADALPMMLSAADRLSAVRDAGIAVCLIASGSRALADLEGDVRLALADRPEIDIVAAAIARGALASVVESLRRMRPGLVMSRFGGLVVPNNRGGDGGEDRDDQSDLAPLARGLECPLLLMR